VGRVAHVSNGDFGAVDCVQRTQGVLVKNLAGGVRLILRVDRSNRRTPKARSRSPICLLICARVQSSRRAAAAMLPVSTTLTKLSQLVSHCILSMIR
jgi:hypothetical protein